MVTDRLPTRRSWWQVGLLLVAFFLGHDVLMAMPAQAANQHPETDQHRVASASDMKSTPERPTHPVDCGATSPAVTVSVAQSEFSPGLAPLAMTPWSCSLLAQWLEFRWQEPAWPPGVRRALLQVFRI